MRLDPYLRREGRGALIRLADRLGFTPTKLSKIRYGRQEPTLKEALDIQRETGGAVTAADLVAAREALGSRRRSPTDEITARRSRRSSGSRSHQR